MTIDAAPVIWFDHLRREDVPRVGGKNASLGEMIGNLTAKGIKVPSGFATSADAYWLFVEENDLKEIIRSTLVDLSNGKVTLTETGQTIRRAFLRGEWPKTTSSAIISAYKELCRRSGNIDAAVAVRSSATAEDLPDASFAGQQETYLNIQGESSTHVAVAMPRSSPTGPLAIGKRRVSITLKSRSRSESRVWCGPTPVGPASCSQSIQKPDLIGSC